MTYGTEACETQRNPRFAMYLSQLEATLTDISVAALTTEPELRDMARSLILLVRYHAQRITVAPGRFKDMKACRGSRFTFIDSVP